MTDDSPQPTPKEGTGPRRNSSPHVLLIEDDEQMRELLAEALRRENWHVTECSDGTTWFLSCVDQATWPLSAEAPEDRSFDVIVSDIRMPTMGGLDVMRILRTIHCEDACPPTILITAFGDHKTHRTARELGAVKVLDKPFDVKELVREVRAVIDGEDRDSKE